MTDPRTPTEDLEAVNAALGDIKRRLDTLEAPSGTQAFQTVAKLEALILDMQAQLDAYIAVGLPALVSSTVAAQLAAAFAGSVAIGGNLTVAGTASVTGAVHLPNVPATTFVAEPRTVVWVDTSNGRIGRT